MCIICDNNGTIPEGITKLDCFSCKKIKELPALPPNITRIRLFLL